MYDFFTHLAFSRSLKITGPMKKEKHILFLSIGSKYL